MTVFCQFIILSLTDTSNSYGINTMMNMINTLFLGILFLYPPHLSKVGCCDSFYYIHLFENRLKIHTCIARYNADICALTTRKTFWNFSHCESLILTSPIITLQNQIVTAADLTILLLFRRNSLGTDFPNLLI